MDLTGADTPHAEMVLLREKLFAEDVHLIVNQRDTEVDDVKKGIEMADGLLAFGTKHYGRAGRKLGILEPGATDQHLSHWKVHKLPQNMPVIAMRMASTAAIADHSGV